MSASWRSATIVAYQSVASSMPVADTVLTPAATDFWVGEPVAVTS